MNDRLDRFITIQKENYSEALNEVENGKKVSHWMWYIFPQIRGLGKSDIAIYYSIISLEEANNYWKNDYLRSNLLEITKAFALLNESPLSVFGYIDMKKLKSCMTLFYIVSKEEIFKEIIDKYYEGKFCEKTLEIINKKIK